MGENDSLDYWEQFGYNIAGPVSYAFTTWIWEEIEKNEQITDVFFVARDGYLPNMICAQLNSGRVKQHYVYAPRIMLLRNKPEEMEEYQAYISGIETGGGTIAVVDTFSFRLSSQLLISKSVKSPVIGFYWMLSKSAKEIAAETRMAYISFMKDNDRRVPCWDQVEFILSAPERPVRSIKDGKPQYIDGNENEERRLELYSHVVAGVEKYLKEGSKDQYRANYQAVYQLLSQFYLSPSEEDIAQFSKVSFSSLPDHSDQRFLVRQNVSEAQPHSIPQTLWKKIRYNRVTSKVAVIRRKWLESKRFRGNEERLVQILAQYDVISFDVFDTLVRRKCPQPSSVFEMLEKENGLYDFKNTRKRAEYEATQLHPEMNQEVSINEIYEVIGHYYGEDAPCSIEREVEMELEVCAPNPFMVNVLNRLKEMNKQIVIVSDMYLTKQQIERILHHCQIFGYADVFVSSEYYHSKKTGMLFDDVQRKCGKGLKYIHVGDNLQADYIMARKHGMKSILIKKRELKKSIQ